MARLAYRRRVGVVLIRIALAGALVALAACTAPERQQAVTDALSGAEARCEAAKALYDADRNATAAALAIMACIR